jgi:hypothetical protein
MGENKVIWIPAVLHDEIERFEGKKQIYVILQSLSEGKKEQIKNLKKNRRLQGS